jgi:hypothetical protein
LDEVEVAVVGVLDVEAEVVCLLPPQEAKSATVATRLRILSFMIKGFK